MSEKINAFGKNHDVLGSKDSDLILKTKGGIKVLYGGKYVDLFKDGKINVDDSKFIYESSSVGTNDGIYVIDDKVILKVGDKLITLSGEIGTTYVSFNGDQEVNGEQQYTALKNIGFISTNADDVLLSSGIVYIESSKKLYTISNGTLEEYTFEFPNPFTEQFIISKNDNNTGALVIKGTGELNGVVFDSMEIYSDNYNYITSDNTLYIKIGNVNSIKLKKTDVTISPTLICDTIQSSDESFKLYSEYGTSYLKVDELSTTPNLYPEFYYKSNDIINYVSDYYEDEDEEDEDEDEDEEDEDEDDDDDDIEYYKYYIKTVYGTEYSVGDLLSVILKVSFVEDDDEDDEDESITFLYKFDFIVTEISDDYTLIELQINSENESIIEHIDFEELLLNKIIFLISDSTPKTSSDGFEIINTETINSRIGDLTSLGLYMIENEENIPISGSGIYSELGVFKNACYDSNYILSQNDNSSRFASTEWVKKYVENLINKT